MPMQGKWARIGVIASSTDIDCGCFTNLDLFSYDQSLLPSTGSSNNEVCPSFIATVNGIPHLLSHILQILGCCRYNIFLGYLNFCYFFPLLHPLPVIE